MRRALTTILLPLWLLTAQSQDDVLLRAMRDELQRSRELSLANLGKPFYIEYSIDDLSAFNTSSSLGALIVSNEAQTRIPRIQVRVGDYTFDNTNYLYTDAFSGGRDQYTVDNDYTVLRRGLWLGTDRAYKGALEAIARKRAALKNLTQPETLADFWKAEPVQRIGPRAVRPAGWDKWSDRVRSLSSIFANYPEIVSSGVTFSGTASTFYMHNSEGTTLRRAEPVAHLQASGFAYAPDGTIVRDSVSIPRNEESQIPAQPELQQVITGLAENIRALVNAPVGENYVGPVLFEGLAGAQIIAELVAPNVVAARKPIGEPGRPLPYVPGDFEGRLDSRVMPEFLDIVDDPTQKSWQGVPLVGAYEVDEEGVPAGPLTVIEKGRFKTFLLTRQPIQGFSGSNGRARIPGPFGARAASVTNLFVKPSEAVKASELKARFLKMLAERNKPWGMIIRKMDFPSSAPAEEVQRMMNAARQSGSNRLISAPVLAYRVYPDGREELVRGVRFRGLSARSLRDISGVSQEMTAFHYMNNTAPMALQTGGGYVAPVSVIAPSLLFDELEIERPRDDLPNLPVVPPPSLSRLSSSK